MAAMAVTIVILAVIVLGLLFSRTGAERRLRLVQSQIALEKKNIERRADSESVVDTVRSEASLRRIEFWLTASPRNLWRGMR